MSDDSWSFEHMNMYEVWFIEQKRASSYVVINPPKRKDSILVSAHDESEAVDKVNSFWETRGDAGMVRRILSTVKRDVI